MADGSFPLVASPIQAAPVPPVPPPPPPIMVSASSTNAEIETLLGQLVPLLGGALMAYGVIDQAKWAAIAAPLPIVLGAVWRIWRTRREHAKLVVAANAAPNAVAQVR